jgi:hypothetical protein
LLKSGELGPNGPPTDAKSNEEFGMLSELQAISARDENLGHLEGLPEHVREKGEELLIEISLPIGTARIQDFAPQKPKDIHIVCRSSCPSRFLLDADEGKRKKAPSPPPRDFLDIEDVVPRGLPRARKIGHESRASTEVAEEDAGRELAVHVAE